MYTDEGSVWFSDCQWWRARFGARIGEMMMKEFLCGLCAGILMMAVSVADADAADAKKGKKVFNKCKTCHTINKGGKNKIGPNLFGIVGRKSGSVDGFKYSSAMQEANLTWDETTLDKFLKKPKTVVPKTKMIFPGLRKQSQRDDVIAFMKSNGG